MSLKRNKKIIDELKELGVEEIKEKVEEWRRDLFGIRLNSSTSHVKDFSQFKKLRKNISRGLTVLEQRSSEKLSPQTVEADK